MEEQAQTTKMIYRNIITGETGNLKKLLWNVSSPNLLSKEELLQFNIEIVEEVIIELTLDDLKAQKIAEIKSTFEQITNEGFECSNEIKIDIREKDKANWIIALQSGQDQTIRDFNNTIHNITFAEFASMFNEAMLYYKQILGIKWLLEDMVNNSTTKEEVESIWWRKPLFDESGLKIIGYEYNEVL